MTTSWKHGGCCCLLYSKATVDLSSEKEGLANAGQKIVEGSCSSTRESKLSPFSYLSDSSQTLSFCWGHNCHKTCLSPLLKLLFLSLQNLNKKSWKMGRFSSLFIRLQISNFFFLLSNPFFSKCIYIFWLVGVDSLEIFFFKLEITPKIILKFKGSAYGCSLEKFPVGGARIVSLHFFGSAPLAERDSLLYK